VVVLTVGTGIGGGIVLGGRLLRGRFGVAGEIGHINVVPDGRRCGCGLEGCWEQYASGGALVKEAQELAEASPAMAADLLRLAGGKAEMITGPVVTQAAQEGDVAALRCFDVVGTWLGRGMAQLAAVLDPGLFVLGGGVSAAGSCSVGRPGGHCCSISPPAGTDHTPSCASPSSVLRLGSWAPATSLATAE
jgi:glucokinase